EIQDTSHPHPPPLSTPIRCTSPPVLISLDLQPQAILPPLHTHAHRQTHTYIHRHTHACMCAHTHTHTHTHTHIPIYSFLNIIYFFWSFHCRGRHPSSTSALTCLLVCPL